VGTPRHIKNVVTMHFMASWDTDNFDRLRWLHHALRHASIWVADDRELLERIEAAFEPGSESREELVRELERRLAAAATPTLCHQTARTLASLERRYRAPGRQRVRVDQLTMRLLHQLHGSKARTIARRGLTSERLLRRRAAWRFFAVRGMDPGACVVLAATDPEPDKFYGRLVAFEPNALEAVGIARAMPCLEYFSWRARAIQSALTRGISVRDLLTVYPTEALYAVAETGDARHLGIVRDVLRQNEDSAAVIQGAIQAFAALRAHSDLDDALRRGRALLERLDRRGFFGDV
jgi:hypothetical protein